MSEGLFILTTIFVAYVVYVIVSDSKSNKTETKPTPAPQKKPQASKPAPSKPAASKPKPKPAPAKKSEEKKSQPKAAAPSVSNVKELRNPETGEVSAIATNYRFMKRWIKDALVTEGLLDKVYKNNELDDVAAAKINAAIEKIKGLEKYKA